MSKIPSYFIEGVISVSHADGVFRVVLGQRSGASEHSEEACLFIPASQMGNILNTLANAMREIGSKIQEKAEAKTEAKVEGEKEKRPSKSKH